MRESWTDQRLDKFAADTTRRFDDIDKRFDSVDSHLDGIDQRLNEADRRFEMMESCMKDGFARVDADTRELRTQMAAFQRTTVQVGLGTMATVALGFASVVVTQL